MASPSPFLKTGTKKRRTFSRDLMNVFQKAFYLGRKKKNKRVKGWRLREGMEEEERRSKKTYSQSKV